MESSNRTEKRPAPTDTGPLVVVTIVLVSATAGLLVLVGSRLTATQGARASTRLVWEQRAAELEKAARDGERR